MSYTPPRGRRRAGSVLARSLVLAGTVAVPTYSVAADLNVTNTRTDPVTTSNANQGPGNVTVSTGGAVSVSTGAAITVDSSNKVQNDGRIESKAGTDGRGILIDGTGTLTTTITNNGTISLPVDADDKTTDQKNYGIFLAADTAMVGDILNAKAGGITVDGLNSVGILTRGQITGNVTNQGSITAAGAGGIGILIDGTVTGAVVNSGTISTGKAAFTTGFGKDAKTTPETVGGDGLAVSGSVSGGILNDGDTLTLREETDLTNGTVKEVRGLDKEDIGTDGSISIIGGGNALHVGPDAGGSDGAGDITIGAVNKSTYGIINRGDLSSTTSTDKASAEAVRIGGFDGTTTSSKTTVAGGFFNDGGDITVKATSGEARGLAIGTGATLPEIKNTGNIAANASTGDAIAVVVEQNATVPLITNSGIIKAETSGGDAFAIIDRSDTVAAVVNSGTIEALGPGAVAMDFSKSTIDVAVKNTGVITGDVVMGDGADTFTMIGGTLTGDLNLGKGENTFTLENKAAFVGDLSAKEGSVDLVVKGSTFAIASQTGATVRNASFDKDATLSIPIFGSNAVAGTLKATGEVSFADGATLVTDFQTLSATDITFTLVDAETLVFESDLSGLEIADTSAFFNTKVALDPEDAGKIIVTVDRATAQDLGLNPNQTAVFEASAKVLEADTELGAAMARLKTNEEVQDAFNQLMPDNSGATQQGIFKTQAAIFSAINKRMDGIYKLDRRYKERVDRISGKDPKRAEKMRQRDEPTIWAEQLVHVASQSPYGNQLGYGGYSYGIAIGADYPLFGLDAVGISVSQVWSEYREKGSFDRPTAVQSTQFNFYAGIETGGFFVDVSGGYGFSTYDQERQLVIGTVERRMFSDWSGHHMSANLRAGYTTTVGRFSLMAAGSLSYMKLHENGYVETGIRKPTEDNPDKSADGVKLEVAEQDVEFLRGALGFQAGLRIEDGTGIIEPQVRFGMTHEFSYKGPVNRANFLSGSSTLDFRCDRLSPGQFCTVGELGSATTFYAGTGVDLSAHFGTLSFDYDVEFGGGRLNHIVAGTVRVSF
jgi:uncharacterized protein with beta-barrel porin domain